MWHRVCLQGMVSALPLALCLPLAAQVSVLTYHNDAARTGQNTNETILTPANVNTNSFGLVLTRAVDDQIYAQPLVVANVNVPGKGTHNVVYVATNNDSVYAFDADDPAAAAPIWRVNYTNPAAGIVPVSRTDVGQTCGAYTDFAGNIGIGGTPAIDPVAQTMYFVARTKENGTFVQRLHAIDIRDGSERPGSPLIVQASVVGTGDGRDAQNNIAFNARTQNQRAGLLLDELVAVLFHQRERPDRRPGRAAELQRDADEAEFTVSRGGQLLQVQILDDVNAVGHEQVHVAVQHHVRVGIPLFHRVPGHVVGADRADAAIRRPHVP